MRKKIPSTHALLAFESAARHQSFTRAAEELALTQSAVCRQINALEDYLGVPLFRRTRRGVQLTEAGQDYSRQIGPRLDALEQGEEILGGDRRPVKASEGGLATSYGTDTVAVCHKHNVGKFPENLIRLVSDTIGCRTTVGDDHSFCLTSVSTTDDSHTLAFG